MALAPSLSRAVPSPRASHPLHLQPTPHHPTLTLHHTTTHHPHPTQPHVPSDQVAVAGIMGALRQSHPPADLSAAFVAQRFLCAGAGSAGIGICKALRDAVVLESGAPAGV